MKKVLAIVSVSLFLTAMCAPVMTVSAQEPQKTECTKDKAECTKDKKECTKADKKECKEVKKSEKKAKAAKK